MCGRIARSNEPAYYIERVAPEAHADILDDPTGRAGFNITPSQHLLALQARVGVPDSAAWTWLRWGLVPVWADAPGQYKLINARAETVATKPSFRTPFRQRRCLIPVDGYYEWQPQADGPKQPFFIYNATGDPLVLAGLWDHWVHGDEVVDSCTILTTAPVGANLHAIHNRRPVVVPPDQRDLWLFGSPHEVQGLLHDTNEASFVFHPVSRRVNNPRNDAPDLLDPVAL